MTSLYNTVLLVGGPGTGKGTQGKMLAAIPGFHHCSSGDIFRALDPQSELGRTFHQYSSRGELVPDELTVRMWADHMAKRVAAKQFDPASQILLLDGIPRTPAQAKLMDATVKVLKVIYLTCDDASVMVERIRKRALKEGRKDDADENVIRRRWEVYERETKPVIDHYPAKDIARIDAIGTPATVLLRVLQVLAPLQEATFPA